MFRLSRAPKVRCLVFLKRCALREWLAGPQILLESNPVSVRAQRFTSIALLGTVDTKMPGSFSKRVAMVCFEKPVNREYRDGVVTFERTNINGCSYVFVGSANSSLKELELLKMGRWRFSCGVSNHDGTPATTSHLRVSAGKHFRKISLAMRCFNKFANPSTVLSVVP